MLETNSQLELATEFICNTGANLFLTGRAGSGKSTLLRTIAATLPKRMVIAAPTGVAAFNVEGVTLHSLFQLPFAPYLPNEGGHNPSNESGFRRMSKQKRALIRSIELLVIDEISMVRCDLLDAMDDTLRRVRGNSEPFGGVQLLLIGDIQQLSPICRDAEWELLHNYYDSPYFFESKALKRCNYVTIELQKIYRQRDPLFTEILNGVRENNLSPTLLAQLNERYRPLLSPQEQEGYITLTTHNHRAQAINEARLGALTTSSRLFRAVIEKDFPEAIYPNEAQTLLKVGAQVMFVKNDPSPEHRFYNGMIGSVTALKEGSVVVTPQGGGAPIEVSPLRWENMEYLLNSESGVIEEKAKGSFTQIPLKCAWAITIHKSQGLSFDRVIVDAENSFAHGQVYVALSRCRSLEGLILSAPLQGGGIGTESHVEAFNRKVEAETPTLRDLEQHKRNYFLQLLQEIFSFASLDRTLYRLTQLFEISLFKEYPLLTNQLRELLSKEQQELYGVGENFKIQLARGVAAASDYTQDAYIQERLVKSSHYFTEKLAPILTLAEELDGVEIDAKDTRTRITKLRDELREELAIKQEALALCGVDFSCEAYLERKFAIIAQGAKKEKKEKKSAPKGLKVNSDILHKELYESLISWRKERAAALNQPAYTVLTNRSVVEIQALLPLSLNQLKEVQGVGKVKLDLYGEEILELVFAYAKSEGIDTERYHREKQGYLTGTLNLEEIPNTPKAEKVPRVATHLKTLQCFREGLNIAEIAKERELSIGTIYSHMALLVKGGKVAVEELVEAKKIARIEAAMARTKSSLLGELKGELGDAFSYEEIRLVIASKADPTT